MRISALTAVAALLALPPFTLCAQGLAWETTSSGAVLQHGETRSRTIYMPGMIKHTQGDSTEVIFRLDKEMISTVNHRDKTYSELTFQELEGSVKRAGAAMDEKMAEVQKQLEAMPKEQREAVEKMMEGHLPKAGKEAKIEVTQTKEEKTIGGFNCTKTLVTQDGKDFFVAWTTRDVKGFDAMGKEFREYSRRMAAMLPGRGKATAEAMKQLDGFPVQTEIPGTITMTVTKVEHRSTPEKEFEVPKGYKKVKSMMEEMNEQMEGKDKKEE